MITGRREKERNPRALRFLEALAIKLQRPTVLRDSADDIFWSAGRYVSFDFNGDLHLGVQQARQVLNDRSGYHIGVP